MDDYELLDFGNGRRLEQFGKNILDRPCPVAERFRAENPVIWNTTDARFVFSSKNTQRGHWTSEPEPWTIQFGLIKMELRCTPFGHVGVFPEQQTNWQRITKHLTEASKKRMSTIRVLNLFAYTGGSSLAAASAAPNVEVVHVDSAKSVVDWAKRNAELNGIKKIRFMVEDVRKLVRRELKRGNRYDAVILDPPSYGHGLRGEAWKLTEHLPALLTDIVNLLSEEPIFVLLTAHTPGFDSDTMQKMLQDAGLFRKIRNKKIRVENISMAIPSATAKQLPSGCGVWEQW